MGEDKQILELQHDLFKWSKDNGIILEGNEISVFVQGWKSRQGKIDKLENLLSELVQEIEESTAYYSDIPEVFDLIKSEKYEQFRNKKENE